MWKAEEEEVALRDSREMDVITIVRQEWKERTWYFNQ
jgi:hypothetical protein